MTVVYQVYLAVAYEPDQVFGTFKSAAEASKYRDELIADANMSHYKDIEVGTVWIWDSVEEMKVKQAEEIAKWEAANRSEDEVK